MDKLSNIVLYDAQWQKLRVSFLKENHDKGGFSTREGTADNIRRLETYIQGATDAQDKAVRVWRAINLLNATRMGYSGQGVRGSSQDRLVEDYRNSLQPQANSALVAEAGRQWDWDQARRGYVSLKRNEPKWFDAVLRNLKKRATFATKKRGDLSYRPNLVKTIEIMEGI